MPHSVTQFLTSSAAVCDAVLRLRGPALTAELGRIAAAVTGSPWGRYVPEGVTPGSAAPRGALLQELAYEQHRFGRFEVAGRDDYDDIERQHLASLAGLAASVLQVHERAQRTTHAYVQVEAQL